MARIDFSSATKGTFSKTVSVPADEFGRPNTNPPGIVDLGNVTLYSFTLNTDHITYKFPVPTDYAGGDIDFSIIWTNDGGVDDNSKAVKWQLDYQVASEGDAIDGSHTNSPKSTEDTYDSALGWVEYHTDNMTIDGADFTGKLCIFLNLSAITPEGTALTGKPHLIGICFTYIATWGRKP